MIISPRAVHDAAHELGAILLLRQPLGERGEARASQRSPPPVVGGGAGGEPGQGRGGGRGAAPSSLGSGGGARLDRARRLLGTEGDSPLRHHRAVVDELLVDDPRDERGEVGEGELGRNARTRKPIERSCRFHFGVQWRSSCWESTSSCRACASDCDCAALKSPCSCDAPVVRAGAPLRTSMFDEDLTATLARAALRILGRGGEQLGAAARQRRRRRGAESTRAGGAGGGAATTSDRAPPPPAPRRRGATPAPRPRRASPASPRASDPAPTSRCAGRLRSRSRSRRSSSSPTARARRTPTTPTWPTSAPCSPRTSARCAVAERPSDAAVRPDVAAVRAGEGGEAPGRQFAVVVDGRRRRGAVLDAGARGVCGFGESRAGIVYPC